MKRAFTLLLFLFSGYAVAAPTTHLVLGYSCPPGPPYEPCPAIADPAFDFLGSPISAYVAVVDDSGQRVPSFTGTVNFSSSDPTAIFPSSHTFKAEENSVYWFTFTFRSHQGAFTLTAVDGTISYFQSISVADNQGGAPVRLGLMILGNDVASAPVAAPTMDGGMTLFMGVLFCVIALRNLSQRSELSNIYKLRF